MTTFSTQHLATREQVDEFVRHMTESHGSAVDLANSYLQPTAPSLSYKPNLSGNNLDWLVADPAPQLGPSDPDRPPMVPFASFSTQTDARRAHGKVPEEFANLRTQINALPPAIRGLQKDIFRLTEEGVDPEALREPSEQLERYQSRLDNIVRRLGETGRVETTVDILVREGKSNFFETLREIDPDRYAGVLSVYDDKMQEAEQALADLINLSRRKPEKTLSELELSEAIPFVSTLRAIDEYKEIHTAIRNIGMERDSAYDRLVVGKWLINNQREADSGILFKALGVGIDSLPYMLEIILTGAGGVALAGAKATGKAITKKMIASGIGKALVQKGFKGRVSRAGVALGESLVAGNIAATINPMVAVRGYAEAARRSLPGASFDEAQNILVTMDRTDDSAFTDAVASRYGEGYLDAYIEAFSESTAMFLGAAAHTVMLDSAYKWLKTVTVGRAGRALRKAGVSLTGRGGQSKFWSSIADSIGTAKGYIAERALWNGLLGEIGEERVGDALRYATGLQDHLWPEGEDLLVEAIGLALFPLGGSVAQGIPKIVGAALSTQRENQNLEKGARRDKDTGVGASESDATAKTGAGTPATDLQVSNAQREATEDVPAAAPDVVDGNADEIAKEHRSSASETLESMSPEELSSTREDAERTRNDDGYDPASKTAAAVTGSQVSSHEVAAEEKAKDERLEQARARREQVTQEQAEKDRRSDAQALGTFVQAAPERAEALANKQVFTRRDAEELLGTERGARLDEEERRQLRDELRQQLRKRGLSEARTREGVPQDQGPVAQEGRAEEGIRVEDEAVQEQLDQSTAGLQEAIPGVSVVATSEARDAGGVAEVRVGEARILVAYAQSNEFQEALKEGDKNAIGGMAVVMARDPILVQIMSGEGGLRQMDGLVLEFPSIPGLAESEDKATEITQALLKMDPVQRMRLGFLYSQRGGADKAKHGYDAIIVLTDEVRGHTLTHETVHALRYMGVISNQDALAIARWWLRDDLIEDMPSERTASRRRIEEAVAEALTAILRGEVNIETPAEVHGILQRIIKALETLFRAFGRELAADVDTTVSDVVQSLKNAGRVTRSQLRELEGEYESSNVERTTVEESPDGTLKITTSLGDSPIRYAKASPWSEDQAPDERPTEGLDWMVTLHGDWFSSYRLLLETTDTLREHRLVDRVHFFNATEDGGRFILTVEAGEALSEKTLADIEEVSQEYPLDEDGQQLRMFQIERAVHKFVHLSNGDRTLSGILKEFRGTGAVGRERMRIFDADGNLKPEEAAVNLYTLDGNFEWTVLSQAKYMHLIQANLRLLSRDSEEEYNEVRRQALINGRSPYAQAKQMGYDGYVETDELLPNGHHVILWRSVTPSEIIGTKELTPELRREFQNNRSVRKASDMFELARNGAPNPSDYHVRALAMEYALIHRVPYRDREEYVPVDEDLAREIADAYEAMEHDPSGLTETAYAAFKEEALRQYSFLVSRGFTFEPWLETSGQPYLDSADMQRDVMKNQHLSFYVTITPQNQLGLQEEPRLRQTITFKDGRVVTVEGKDGNEIRSKGMAALNEFGDGNVQDIGDVEEVPSISDDQASRFDGPADNPLLERTGITINGYTLTYNDVFRAVHDVFGHASGGFGFGPRGEENAWRKHVRMFSPLAARAMTTETRGQNSWVNYGPHLRRPDGYVPKRSDADFIPLDQRPFAKQKTGLLPEHMAKARDLSVSTAEAASEGTPAETLSSLNIPTSAINWNKKVTVGDTVYNNKKGHGSKGGLTVDVTSHIVFMDPAAFLQLNPLRPAWPDLSILNRAGEAHGMGDVTALQAMMGMAGFHELDRIHTFLPVSIERGDAIAMPQLFVKWQRTKWKVVAHEGRGRSMTLAAIRPGQLIPVRIMLSARDADRGVSALQKYARIESDEAAPVDWSFAPHIVVENPDKGKANYLNTDLLQLERRKGGFLEDNISGPGAGAARANFAAVRTVFADIETNSSFVKLVRGDDTVYGDNADAIGKALDEIAPYKDSTKDELNDINLFFGTRYNEDGIALRNTMGDLEIIKLEKELEARRVAEKEDDARTRLIAKRVKQWDKVRARAEGLLESGKIEKDDANTVLRKRNAPANLKWMDSGLKKKIGATASTYDQMSADLEGTRKLTKAQRNATKNMRNELNSMLARKRAAGNLLDRVSNTVAHEVKAASLGTKVGDGWYDKKIQEMMAWCSALHPELMWDHPSQTLFKLLAAVTSNGATVRENIKNALLAYGEWKDKGVLSGINPETNELYNGTRGPLVRMHMRMVQTAIERFGVENLDAIFLSPLNPREASIIKQEIVGKASTKVTGEYDDIVLSASIVFGPKLGSFFANQMGIHSLITMDTWLARTWYRQIGRITKTESEIADDVERGRDMLREHKDWLADNQWALLGFKYKDLMEDQNVAKAAGRAVRQAKAGKDSARYSEWYERMSKAEDDSVELKIRKALGVFDRAFAFRATPDGAAERNTIRTVLTNVVNMAQRGEIAGVSTTLRASDIQAILWYAEQRLWIALGLDKKSRTESIDFADAARDIVMERAKERGIEIKWNPEDGAIGVDEAVQRLQGRLASSGFGRPERVGETSWREVRRRAFSTPNTVRLIGTITRTEDEGTGSPRPFGSKLGSPDGRERSDGEFANWQPVELDNGTTVSGVNYRWSGREAMALLRRGVVPVDVIEMEPSDSGIAQFVEIQNRYREDRNAHDGTGGQVDKVTAEDLVGSRMFISVDGGTLAAVKPDGEISYGVSSVPEHPQAKSGFGSVLIRTVQAGGKYSWAFDTFLPAHYAKFGLKGVYREAWNEDLAADDWDYDAMRPWSDGRPGVIMMVYDGGRPDLLPYRIKQFVPYSAEAVPNAEDIDTKAALKHAHKQAKLSSELFEITRRPGPLKKLTGESAWDFDAKYPKSHSLFSLERNQDRWWYSPTRSAIADWNIPVNEKMDAKSVLGRLRKVPGVKQRELDYMGIPDILENWEKKSITKGDLLSIMDSGQDYNIVEHIVNTYGPDGLHGYGVELVGTKSYRGYGEWLLTMPQGPRIFWDVFKHEDGRFELTSVTMHPSSLFGEGDAELGEPPIGPGGQELFQDSGYFSQRTVDRWVRNNPFSPFKIRHTGMFFNEESAAHEVLQTLKGQLQYEAIFRGSHWPIDNVFAHMRGGIASYIEQSVPAETQLILDKVKREHEFIIGEHKFLRKSLTKLVDEWMYKSIGGSVQEDLKNHLQDVEAVLDNALGTGMFVESDAWIQSLKNKSTEEFWVDVLEKFEKAGLARSHVLATHYPVSGPAVNMEMIDVAKRIKFGIEVSRPPLLRPRTTWLGPTYQRFYWLVKEIHYAHQNNRSGIDASKELERVQQELDRDFGALLLSTDSSTIAFVVDEAQSDAVIAQAKAKKRGERVISTPAEAHEIGMGVLRGEWEGNRRVERAIDDFDAFLKSYVQPLDEEGFPRGMLHDVLVGNKDVDYLLGAAVDLDSTALDRYQIQDTIELYVDDIQFSTSIPAATATPPVFKSPSTNRWADIITGKAIDTAIQEWASLPSHEQKNFAIFLATGRTQSIRNSAEGYLESVQLVEVEDPNPDGPTKALIMRTEDGPLRPDTLERLNVGSLTYEVGEHALAVTDEDIVEIFGQGPTSQRLMEMDPSKQEYIDFDEGYVAAVADAKGLSDIYDRRLRNGIIKELGRRLGRKIPPSEFEAIFPSKQDKNWDKDASYYVWTPQEGDMHKLHSQVRAQTPLFSIERRDSTDPEKERAEVRRNHLLHSQGSSLYRGKNPRMIKTERVLLNERFRNQARGARAGFTAARIESEAQIAALRSEFESTDHTGRKLRQWALREARSLIAKHVRSAADKAKFLGALERLGSMSTKTTEEQVAATLTELLAKIEATVVEREWKDLAKMAKRKFSKFRGEKAIKRRRRKGITPEAEKAMLSKLDAIHRLIHEVDPETREPLRDKAGRRVPRKFTTEVKGPKGGLKTVFDVDAAKAQIDEVEELMNEFDAIYAASRALVATMGAKLKLEVKEAAAKVAESMKDAGKRERESGFGVEDADSSYIESVRIGLEDLRNLCQRCEGRSDSLLEQYLYVEGTDREEDFLRHVRDRQEALDHLAAKIEGIRGVGELQAKADRRAGRAVVETLKVTLGGEEVEITLDEAMWFAAIDNETYARIAAGRPVKRVTGRQGKEGTTISAEEIDAVRAALPPEIVRFIAEAKALIEADADSVWDVLIELNGRVPPRVEGYFPTQAERSPTKLPDNAREVGSFFVEAYAEKARFSKERTKDLKSSLINTGFIETLMDHIELQAKVLHLSKWARTSMALIHDPVLSEAIKTNHGPAMHEALKTHIIAASRMDSRSMDAMGKAASFLNTNLAVAKLGLNMTSWMKQLGGVFRIAPVSMDIMRSTLGMNEAELKNAGAIFAKGAANWRGGITFQQMVANSGYLWERYVADPAGRISPIKDERAAFERRSATQLLSAMEEAGQNIWAGDIAAAWRDLRAVGLSTLQILNYFDSINARIAWSGFAAVIESRHPEWSEAAKLEWIGKAVSHTVRETQNSSSPFDMSTFPLRSRGTGWSVLFLFSSDTYKSANRMRRAARRGKGDFAAVFAGEIGNILWSVGATNGVALLFATLAYALWGNDDDDWDLITKRIFSLEDEAFQVAQELSGLISPFTLPKIVSSIRYDMHRRNDIGLFESPVAEQVEAMVLDVVKVFTEPARVYNKSGDLSDTAGEVLARLLNFSNDTMVLMGFGPLDSIWGRLARQRDRILKNQLR